MNDLATEVQGAQGTILQCECCLRYFRSLEGGAAVLVALPKVLVVPESFVCGLAECGAIAAGIEQQVRAVDAQAQRVVLAERERIRQVRAQAKLKVNASKSGCRLARKKTSNAQRSTLNAQGAAAPRFERGCPVDTELMEEKGRGVGISEFAGDAVGSSQDEFLAAVDVGPAHQKLLDYFRAHYGKWCSLPVLEVVCEHHAVNSRCSELRRLIPGDHDIDQMNLPYEPTGKAHSHYRLCLKVESERLKRKAQRDEGQGEFQ